MKHKVINSSGGISEFETDEEFINFTFLILERNKDDGWFTIENTQDSIDYLTDYCSNLNYEENNQKRSN